uniref:Tick transposon n=1 Tax=Rhipicephalus zambeziensis TaxID=60191 RepID=A0A224Z9F1_9ACAR
MKIRVFEQKKKEKKRSRSRGARDVFSFERRHCWPFLALSSYVTSVHGVDLVFTAPCKLSRLCNLAGEKTKKPVCGKKHKKPFVPCATEVVYKIPLSCGKAYIGQTGRCLNDRLREHATTVNAQNDGAHLPAHCSKCGCKALLEAADVMNRAKGRREREIVEAEQIEIAADACISAPSVHLTMKELNFLQGS